MTWLTWRQSRTELLIGGIALVSLAIFLIWTGREIMSAYQAPNLARHRDSRIVELVGCVSRDHLLVDYAADRQVGMM
jgi:hypothetical protein